jgi:hypothetical protein
MGGTSDGVPYRQSGPTYGRRMEPSQVVPGPLGWCSWCLASEIEVRVEAVTTIDGFAVCHRCNVRGNRIDQATAAELFAEWSLPVIQEWVGWGWKKLRVW